MSKVRCQIVLRDGQEVVEEIHKIVVHKFRVGDAEDPDLYAADPILQWEKSEAGQFIMNNAIEPPIWQRSLDYASYGYTYAIIAELEKKKLSEFYLKFDKPFR